MDHHRDTHNHLHHHHPAPTPPPPPYKPSVEGTPVVMPGLLSPPSFPNGSSLKNHRHDPPQRPQPPWLRRNGHVRGTHVVYTDCMKNHAASLGGHALDGCGEFMTSPSSLACAACGCHRNFHRRLVLHSVSAAHDHRHREEDVLDEDGGDDDDDDECHNSSPPPPPQTSASNQYCSSAPHLLMTLSAESPSPATALPMKRFRSKFSVEQRERMQELSERLGWRMQKRDEALVEERCREIGVSRGVFKVWLHNNKHAFGGGASSRRGAAATASGGGVGGAGGETGGYGGGGGGGGGVSVNGGGGDELSGLGNRGSGGHVENSSSLSS